MPGRSAERSPCPIPPELDEFLQRAEFPISREELIALAEEGGAPQAVRQVLEALAPMDFETPGEVHEAAEALSR